MTPRRIIRDENTLYGRWHFEDTTIPITLIRADAAAGIERYQEPYLNAGLTEEEIAIALVFEAPDVRTTELYAQYAAATIACACGEATHVTISGYNEAEATCPCGRRWRIRLVIESRCADGHRV